MPSTKSVKTQNKTSSVSGHLENAAMATYLHNSAKQQFCLFKLHIKNIEIGYLNAGGGGGAKLDISSNSIKHQ